MTDTDMFQDDLKAYADGELAWPRRLAVHLHLTRCASCREELTQMTQIAEDLRTSEPDEALDPALRAKILGIAGEEPNPAAARLSLPSEGRMPDLSAGIGTSTPPGLGAGGRKRPALAWVLAGAALVAWFVFFPLFQGRLGKPGSMTLSAPGAAPSVPSAFKSQAPEAIPPPPTAYHRHIVPAPAAASAPSRYADRNIIVNGSYPGAGGGGYPGGGAFDVATLPPRRSTPAPMRGYPGGGASDVATSEAPQRQVHKEATIGIRVANPEATSDKVADMVKETGGFVAANNMSTGDDGLKSAELTVKVPVTQFETFLGQVARLGNVQSKNITGEDITEKTSDADQTENVLEGDVQNSEARLKALRSKAKWSDQQATRDLRIQLAESRARLMLLKRMAALSTVTIDLSQTPKPQAQAPVTGGFLNGLKASTHDALGSLVSSAGALIALVIWLLAYAPLWIPTLLVGRYALREYRKRQVV